MTERTRPDRRTRRRRRWRWPARLLVLAGAALVFVAGVALGEALKDGPKAGVQTLVRTLRPLPLVPIVQTTVTVTTESPSSP